MRCFVSPCQARRSRHTRAHPTAVSRIIGPYALEASDFTACVDLTDLPLGQQIFTRVAMDDLSTGRVRSEWLMARFRTPSLDARRGPRFVWGGDTAGQNFGKNASGQNRFEGSANICGHQRRYGVLQVAGAAARVRAR